MSLKKIPILLFLWLAHLASANAQFVNQIDFQGLDYYEAPRSAKMVVDYISLHTVANAVTESLTSPLHDISLTQFDDHGDLLWSKRVGQFGVDEVGNAAVRGNADDIIVVGQRNFNQGFITAVNGLTGVHNWTRSISDIQGTEELTTVAEIGTTDEYIALGTSRYGSSHEVFVVKFQGVNGNVLWSLNNQPPSVPVGSPSYQIIPTNMVHIPGQPLMLVTGTVIQGNYTKAFAAHLSTVSGQFTLFKVFDISISSATDASTGSDICMINNQESAMVFTTHKGGIGGPCYITYMRLSALLVPTFQLVYEVFQPGSPPHQLEYGYGTNVYLQGNNLAVGMTVGIDLIDQALGSLQIDLTTGNALNIETYSSFSDLHGSGMVEGQSGQYFFKSGFSFFTDEFQFISTDVPSTALQSLCINSLTAQPNAAQVSYTDLAFATIPHGTVFINFPFTDPVNGVYQNHCPANGNGGLIAFKKGPTSIDGSSAPITSLYPSTVRNGETITIESDAFANRNTSIIVSNALGQLIHQEIVAVENNAPLLLPAQLLEQGINFISILDGSGTKISSYKVIKI